MENAIYGALSRQSGLLSEMSVIANNLANSSTSGFRAQGAVFSEFVRDTGAGQSSLSMARFAAFRTDLTQGAMTQTNGAFDFAIEGDGFFAVQTEAGAALTRAGSFVASPEGFLVTPDGYPVLDGGLAPVFVPPGVQTFDVSADGTIAADGVAIGQVGVFMPEDLSTMTRRSGAMFATESDLLPVDGAKVLQGFVESSNVSAVREITRMISVQRAYEAGQKLLDEEHDRIRSVMQALTK